MAELSTLARPYAEAAFKSANQANNVKEWSDALLFLSAISSDADLSEIINNPRISKDKLTGLLLDICQDQINNQVTNLVKLLVQNRKLKLLPTISVLFEAHKAEEEGYINVDLFSAYQLTKAEQNKYNAMLEKLLNKKVITSVSVDKSLIGGVLAKAGDKVIDGSIRGQINQLAKRL
jgi:F-type H+-transporting ATPase subunit delta